MTENRGLQVGTADPNGTPTAIFANVVNLGSDVPVAITLSKDYAMLRPPGYPSRPLHTGRSAANLDFSKTIPHGTTIKLLKHEADALVTAGAATYA